MLSGLSLVAQNPTLHWMHQFGNTNRSTLGSSLDLDKDGNVYMAGSFESSIDLDPGPNVFNLTGSNWNDNLFISKLDDQGAFIWAKSIVTHELFQEPIIHVDDSSNVYIYSSFKGIVDFDPGTGVHTLIGSTNWATLFVLKLDSNGNFLWVKKIEGGQGKTKIGIKSDKSGAIYLTGIFRGTVDFDPDTTVYNLTSAGGIDIFILKLKNGQFDWAMKIGSTADDLSSDIAIDDKANILLAGSFSGTVDFNPGPAIDTLKALGPTWDAFFLKLDSAGNFIWVKQITGVGFEYIESIAIDTSNGVLATGSITHNADFDPGTGVHTLQVTGGSNIFISKLDSLGHFAWAKILTDSGGYNSGSTIRLDSKSNIYLSGVLEGWLDCKPGPGTHPINTNGQKDFFLSRFTPSGNIVWAQANGSSELDALVDFQISGKDGIYGLGYFNDTMNFRLSQTSKVYVPSGVADFFIQKIAQCDSNKYGTISPVACNWYKSPSGEYTWTTSGTYKDTVFSNLGCDSIITVHLTVKPVDTSVSVLSSSLTSNAVNAQYQWIDCKTGNPIPGETNQKLNVVTKGQYAVAVTKNGCTDTSRCYDTSPISLVQYEAQIFTKIYPNPVQSELIIKPEYTVDIKSIRIRNMQGRTLLEAKGNLSNKVIIDVTHLAAGVYLVDVFTTKTTFTTKVLKIE